MKNNFISRREFIKLGGGLAGLLLVPSLGLSTAKRGEAIEYLSELRKLPDELEKNIYYAAYIENFGWTDWSYDGIICGSPDKKRAVGALAIVLKEGIASYDAYLQNLSWTDWYGGGDVCGFINGGCPYEAFKVRVPGGDALYRAHFYGSGWTEWHKNGKTCGSPRSGKILNALEMKLSDKK